VSRNRPEEQRQSGDKHRDQDTNPDGATHQEFLDVRLANAESAERGCLGLAEENKDGVKFVLVGYKEQYRQREGDEELGKKYMSGEMEERTMKSLRKISSTLDVRQGISEKMRPRGQSRE
jgi:hypothetical protein